MPTKKRSSEEDADELRPEYDLAGLLSEGVQGKYAQSYREGTNLALLEPEIAQAFPNDDAVNEALRLVLRLTKVPRAAAQ